MATKKKTGLWIGLSILILGVLYLAYYLFFSRKARLRRLEGKRRDGTITDKENNELEILVQSEYKPESFPLKQWMKGPNVLNLQKKLNTSPQCHTDKMNRICNNKSLYPLDEDGMFGECTKKALINCQGIFALNEPDYVQMMNPYITKQTGRSLNWA